MLVEPKGFSDRYAARYESTEEEPVVPEISEEPRQREPFALKITGLVLVLVGAFSLVGVMAAAWMLFVTPETIEYFAGALGSLETTDKTHLLTLAVWMMVMLVLLTIARIALFLIDAGLKIRRNSD